MEKGIRRLKEKLVLRGTSNVGTIPAGCFVEITQVDTKNNKVLIHNHWVATKLIEDISEAAPKI